MLVDSKADRIAVGPPDAVDDLKKILGTTTIVNGLSCMSCHTQGMKREFKDTVRFGIAGWPLSLEFPQKNSKALSSSIRRFRVRVLRPSPTVRRSNASLGKGAKMYPCTKS